MRCFFGLRFTRPVWGKRIFRPLQTISESRLKKKKKKQYKTNYRLICKTFFVNDILDKVSSRRRLLLSKLSDWRHETRKNFLNRTFDILSISSRITDDDRHGLWQAMLYID